MNKITQFSTMNALLVGLYDGFFTVEELLQAGNIGIGCSCGIDGELILSNNDCYVARTHQALQHMQHDEKVPFAQIAQFEPKRQEPIKNIRHKEQLTQHLLDVAQSHNLFIGFKIKGHFKKVKLRQPPIGIKKPYPPMLEVFKNQTEETLTGVNGTLIGFWSPEQYQGVAVAGIHIHFIDDEQVHGGHVLDVDITQAILEQQQYDTLEIKLPTSATFLKKDLNFENLDDAVKQAEN